MSKEQGLEAYAHIRFLSPAECHFERSPGGLLSLELDGQVYQNVAIYRAFPFTFGDRYLSVRDKDDNELGIIRSLAEFDRKTQALLREELERRYFVPVITRIERIKEEFGYVYWDVETDRGPRRFTVRGIQQSVLSVGPDRLLIIDVDGNRFEIPKLSALDQKSIRLLETLL